MQTELYQLVASATRDEYEVLAELGHAPAHGTAYLARDLTAGGPVLLLVPPNADAVDVVGALSDAVPAGAGRCTSCGVVLSAWTEVCPRCTRSLTAPVGDGHAAPDAAVVAAEAGRSIEILGAVPHARGGHLFFGRDPIDRRLIAFAARPWGDAGVWIDPLWEADTVLPAPRIIVEPTRPVAGTEADSAPVGEAPSDDGRIPAETAPATPRRRGLGAFFGGRLGALVACVGAASALTLGR